MWRRLCWMAGRGLPAMRPEPPFDVALSYLRRGWMPIPIPHRSKNPNFKNWSQFKIGEAELSAHFNGHPQNLGVLLGEVSGDLVDVDLDCHEALLLASNFLPRTGAIFGRDSKRHSRWLFLSSLTTKRFRDPVAAANHDKSEGDKGMLVELRSTGCQTIFPGSTHTSGEIITWDADGEPERIEAQELERAAGR